MLSASCRAQPNAEEAAQREPRRPTLRRLLCSSRRPAPKGLELPGGGAREPAVAERSAGFGSARPNGAADSQRHQWTALSGVSARFTTSRRARARIGALALARARQIARILFHRPCQHAYREKNSGSLLKKEDVDRSLGAAGVTYFFQLSSEDLVDCIPLPLGYSRSLLRQLPEQEPIFESATQHHVITGTRRSVLASSVRASASTSARSTASIATLRRTSGDGARVKSCSRGLAPATCQACSFSVRILQGRDLHYHTICELMDHLAQRSLLVANCA